MKVVQYLPSKTIELFPLEEFTPLGDVSERAVLEAIGQRYQFLIAPDLRLPRAERRSGLLFEHGQFGSAPINSMAIHDDGVVISAKRTDIGDAFLDEIKGWLIADFGFRSVAGKRIYLSDVVIDFDKPLEGLLAAAKLLNEIVMRHVNEDSRPSTASKAVRIDWGYFGERESLRFILDRRGANETESERYYSSAPLTSEHHIEVLKDIERLMS